MVTTQQIGSTPLVKVKAADMPTYRMLSSFSSVEPTSADSMDEYGHVSKKSMSITPNGSCYGLVRPELLADA